MTLRVIDSRRMTGSNLYTRHSGAIIDVGLDGADAARVVAAWRRAMQRVLPWPGEFHVRHYAGGVALFVTGPLDLLMPLCDLNEWAVACADAELAEQPAAELDPAVLVAIEAAHVPGLTALIDAARTHDVPILVDEDAITLGAGRRLMRFARDVQVPEPAAIDWTGLGRIPIAIVTGTNGKTTTTRLVARIAREAGLVAGITSSDGVAIDEQIIHRGDFSGPEGTRLVLRHPDSEIAILETARGGILRRGLTVERCDAAVITNVTADHLGDYGVDDVATMAQVKAVVGRDARRVILNADNPALVALPRSSFGGEVIWFSRHADNLAIADRGAGTAWFVHDGQLVRADGAEVHALLPVDQVGVSFGGRASYNVENALAAAALAHALGIADAAIIAGLRSFTSSAVDNPGRGNLMDVGGVSVLLDFGHNPAAVRSVMTLARGLLAERGHGDLRVTIGMPGDRSDHDISEVVPEIVAGMPRQVIVRELSPDLLRGRSVGAIPQLLGEAFRRSGLADDAIAFAANELDAVTLALATSQPGDLVLVLVHLDPAVDAMLAAHADLLETFDRGSSGPLT